MYYEEIEWIFSKNMSFAVTSYSKVIVLRSTLSLSMTQLQGRLLLKCDGTRAETIFRLSAKRTSPFKSAGASVQSTTGSRGVRISGSNTGYIMFRSSVKGTDYLLHSPVSPSLSLPRVTVCHHISAELYKQIMCLFCWYISIAARYFRNTSTINSYFLDSVRFITFTTSNKENIGLETQTMFWIQLSRVKLHNTTQQNAENVDSHSLD
jgi:hypothetical protein